VGLGALGTVAKVLTKTLLSVKKKDRPTEWVSFTEISFLKKISLTNEEIQKTWPFMKNRRQTSPHTAENMESIPTKTKTTYTRHNPKPTLPKPYPQSPISAHNIRTLQQTTKTQPFIQSIFFPSQWPINSCWEVVHTIHAW
jgi:hypothetical protein